LAAVFVAPPRQPHEGRRVLLRPHPHRADGIWLVVGWFPRLSIEFSRFGRVLCGSRVAVGGFRSGFTYFGSIILGAVPLVPMSRWLRWFGTFGALPFLVYRGAGFVNPCRCCGVCLVSVSLFICCPVSLEQGAGAVC
jgi:hypothetical protein